MFRYAVVNLRKKICVTTESADSWREFLSWLRGRGLSGVRLVTGDKCAGMLGALEEVFPGARYQRCTVHFYRNVLGRVPVCLGQSDCC